MNMFHLIQYLKDPCAHPAIVVSEKICLKSTEDEAQDEAHDGVGAAKVEHNAQGFRLLNIRLDPVFLWAEWSEYYL